MGSLPFKFIIGTVAGLVAWAIMAPSSPKDGVTGWNEWELAATVLYGCIVGAVIGGLDGWSRGGKVHVTWGLGLGFFLGAIASLIGHQFGAVLAIGMFGPGVFLTGSLAARMVARTLVLTIFGAAMGAAIGGSSRTIKRAIQGLIGGAIGGAIGGVVFDLVGEVMTPVTLAVQGQHSGEVGTISRAIAFTVMAGMIALFIGLVERITRSAWLRLNLGRNEGKEWSIDSSETFIGRSEGAQVPLFGDVNVAPIHAKITKQGGQYLIQDGGSPIGTFVNGQPISQAVLAPGSVIQIGSFALQFLIKGVAAPRMAADMPGRSAGYPLGGPMAPQPGYPQPYGAPMPPPAPVPMGAPTMAMPGPGAGVATVAMPAVAPTSMGMRFTLVGLDGSVIGQRFPIAGPTEVGREGSGIRLGSDSAASRRHAVVGPGSMSVTVQDLGSTNGTFINGQRIQNGEARVGDVVKIGGSAFRVEAG